MSSPKAAFTPPAQLAGCILFSTSRTGFFQI
jgi:hypothetical protein